MLSVCLNAQAQLWHRGNLHMHSTWSDGNVMPEDAVGWYRDHGYQFVCPSDHQILQHETNAWLEVGSKKLSPATADAYLKAHPASAEVKRTGNRAALRLQAGTRYKVVSVIHTIVVAVACWADARQTGIT